MCRISGLVSPDLPIHERERMVKIMCDTQRKGGPDDEGIYTHKNTSVTFGNRRLSFNDLSAAGHQPMLYGNRYVITFNGEIYNFKSIKEKLEQAGYPFNSQSDTEVVVAAYAAWGKESFSMLEGMFAFAIYDEELHEVILVRDPSGIKPLYYFLKKDKLAFASEVKAIKSGLVDLDENKNWPVWLMSFGHIPEPHTLYKDVVSLPKGSFLTLDTETSSTKLEQYHQYSFTSSSKLYTDPAFWVRSAVEKAVQNQLLADVPVGVFLSGGIDSSILSLTANKAKHTALHTLSICFEERNYSEEKYQNLVFERLTGYKHQLVLKKNEFLEHLPNVVDDMDLPSSDGVNTWFISKYTREQGVKGVLSGIGADELFGGYPSFHRMSRLKMLNRVPQRLKSTVSIFPGKLAKRLPYLQLDGAVGPYLFLRGHFGIKEIAKHLDANEHEVKCMLNECEIPNSPDSLEGKTLASWYEYNLYMQNQLLRDSDVMSMAHGVEIRVPFLDHNLVSGVLSMQSSQRFPNGAPKQLLIEAFSELLPEQIWKRKKMGFSFPFTDWLKDNEMVNQWMNKNTERGDFYIRNFEQGEMSWSCFFLLMLLKRYGKI